MSKRIFNMLKISLACAVVVCAMPACQDDHYDVREGGEGGNATLTLWQQIENNPDLSRFARIAEKIPYFKDEAHPQKNYTYKDVLNGSQVLTVFAPTNQAITEQECQEILAACDTSTKAAYNYFLSLVGNHITKNRYQVSATGKKESFRLLNGKKAEFSPTDSIFKETQLVTCNIPATNGFLHTTNSKASFAYNIYEYIKMHSDEYSQLAAWIMKHDTIYFNEELSAEGAPNEMGQPVYVDSIYTRLNTLWKREYKRNDGTEWMFSVKGFSANLECEDSVFAMALPTTTAWNNAVTKIESMYDYASSYPDKRREDEGTDDASPLTCNPDSLKNIAIPMDISSPMVYNCRMQLRTPEQPGFWTAETFDKTPMPKIFNTRTDTAIVDKSLTQDVKPVVFDNSSTREFVSNGVVYPVNSWNFFDLDEALDLEMKLNYMFIFKYEDRGTSTYEQISFVGANSALVQDSLLGSVKKDYFMCISNGNTSPKVQLKIKEFDRDRQIYSGLKYRIKVVMVPNFYLYSPDSIIVNPSVPSDTVIKKNKMNISISYIDGSTSSKGTPKEVTTNFKNIEYSGQRVDTVEVGDITFPKSYKNITNSYPTMTITSSAKNTDVTKNKTYTHVLCIDRIIFEAVKP